MYYSYSCPVCSEVFYTFNDHAEQASQTLFNGIENHMKNYQEQGKDYVLDHPDKMTQDLNTVYSGMSSSDSAPGGGVQLE